MRLLSALAALVFGLACAPIQTRTHFERWKARRAPDAAPAAEAVAAPATTPAAPVRMIESAAPDTANGDANTVQGRDTPPVPRARALRPDTRQDEEEEEPVY